MNENRNKGIGIAKRLLMMPLMAMLFIGGSNEVFAQVRNIIGMSCSNVTSSKVLTDVDAEPSNKEMKSSDQDKASQKEPEMVFTPVEQKAEYPGGNRALQQFFAMNIQYPAEAMEKGLQGRVVVQFMVKKDGSVGEVKIQKGVHPLLDNEAIRLVKSIPHKFKPAKMNGASVNMWYTTGINFVAAVSDKE